MGKDSSKIVSQYVSQDVKKAIANLFTDSTEKQIMQDADAIAKEFGASSSLFENESAEFEEKIISSFQKNLTLLIQKTWVEEADADLKEQVLYKLAEYCKIISKGKWKSAYSEFLEIISDVVYLMFGAMTKTDEFMEYALRIDPEFGFFWFYIKSLPADDSDLDNEKSRIVMLLGMYFLANY